MQLNTPKSIALGRKVHRAFGSWQKAREAATKAEDGTYCLDAELVEKALQEAKR